MLLPELWSFLICARGLEQEGTQASHYRLPVFSCVSLRTSWGFSVGWLPVFGVDSREPVKTPGRELFLEALRQMMLWSASLTSVCLECRVEEGEKASRLRGPRGPGWQPALRDESRVKCSHPPPVQRPPLLYWHMLLELWEPENEIKFCWIKKVKIFLKNILEVDKTYTYYIHMFGILLQFNNSDFNL